MINLKKVREILSPGIMLVTKDARDFRHGYVILSCTDLVADESGITTLKEECYSSDLILLSTLSNIYRVKVNLANWRSLETFYPIRKLIGVNEFSIKFKAVNVTQHCHTEDIIEVLM